MKRFKTKLIAVISLLIFAIPVYADDYLCSYTARISYADKENSKGVSIAKDYSSTTVAGILRQDRANFYVFNNSDSEDEGDCIFHSQSARAKMQKSVIAGSIPQYAKRIIVDQNPLINVDVYSRHVDIEIIESDYNTKPRSSIR